MSLRTRFLTFLMVLSISWTYSQNLTQDLPQKRRFVGSSLFMLANFSADSPLFYQLNYGYWLTSKDVISIEAITWKYSAPLGIPYGASNEKYPGYVREFGIGVAYQRFLWKRLYGAVHALPLLQNYFNTNNQKIQNGFQLFMTYRLGYHIKLFKNRFFLEPSLAVTHWPVNTNTPEAFARMERQWPNYFLLEPGLHFGMKF